jgi:predicted GNAT family acetyltransferase
MIADVPIEPDDDAAIELRDAPERERYEIYRDASLVGFVTYHRGPGRISLRHTEVDDAFEGYGLGSRLIAYALDDARASGRDVAPICPFVRAFIEKHAEYLDLVLAEDRERFGL